jgi:hypothetical protein
MLVEPIVSDAFDNPAFGIPVKLVPVRVGVVLNAGFAPAEPTRTPAAPASEVGTPVEP